MQRYKNDAIWPLQLYVYFWLYRYCPYFKMFIKWQCFFLLTNIVSAAIVCNGGGLIVGGGLAAGPVAIGGEAHGRRGGRGLS